MVDNFLSHILIHFNISLPNKVMQRDTPKTVIAVIASIYFLWCAYNPSNAVFMHLINTPIHEAGHVFFRILGEFMGIAGGSLFQIIVPMVFCAKRNSRKKPSEQ